MNTKENQRTRLSKTLFRNALIEILREKGTVNKISVRELCERAELNRSTFYAHYNEPNDVLTEIENDILEATTDHLQKIGDENDVGAFRYIREFLFFIKENDNTFRTLLVDAIDPEFKSKFMSQSIVQFVDHLEINLPKDTEQYIFSYIMNGSMGIITQWIRSGYSINEETLMKLLFDINRSALVGM